MLINIENRKKRSRTRVFFFSGMDGRELRGRTTTTVIIIIKREPFSTRSCFSTYFESVSSHSLFLSLLFPSFFLVFSRTHASIRCCLRKENRRRPWTTCQKATRMLAIARQTLVLTMLLLLLLLLFLCVIAHIDKRWRRVINVERIIVSKPSHPFLYSSHFIPSFTKAEKKN